MNPETITQPSISPLGPHHSPLSSGQWCEAHLERMGQRVPAHRLGLCRECFAGRPLTRAEELGAGPVNSGDPAWRRRDYQRAYRQTHREQILASKRRWREGMEKSGARRNGAPRD